MRTMLKPRWLGLLGLLAVILVAFTFLGLWQLSVAKDEARKAAIEAAPHQAVVPLSQVMEPHAEFPGDASGRPVEASGHYDLAGQVVVVDRRLDGVSGSWVVTPLVVDGTGARLAVVRGFVPGTPPGAGPVVDGDPVTVVGTLAPSESPVPTSAGLPPGQLGSLDLSVLVNTWDGPLYNAFVFAVSETPDLSAASASAASMPVERIPPPPVPSGLTLRNAAYALQWWVFGLFAAWMYWRMVRDDYRADVAAEAARLSPTHTPTAGAPTA